MALTTVNCFMNKLCYVLFNMYKKIQSSGRFEGGCYVALSETNNYQFLLVSPLYV